MGGPGLNMKLGSAGQRRSSSNDDSDGPRVPENNPSSSGGRSGRSRGPRLWGQAGRKATIGFERTIEIRVLRDRILVGSKDAVVYVGSGESDQEMIHGVIGRIQQRAEMWGEPREGYYWAPKAKFKVYPGGNQYYERLKSELENEWGIPSTVDYVLEKSNDKGDQGKSGGSGK
jgi:hypothetical protein